MSETDERLRAAYKQRDELRQKIAAREAEGAALSAAAEATANERAEILAARDSEIETLTAQLAERAAEVARHQSNARAKAVLDGVLATVPRDKRDEAEGYLLLAENKYGLKNPDDDHGIDQAVADRVAHLRRQHPRVFLTKRAALPKELN